MEKPEFIVGNEKKFAEFIASLNDKDKIALISHTDLDGVVSAKIANEILKVDVVEFVDYQDLTSDFLKEMKQRGVKVLVFTDLLVEGKFIREAEKNFKTLVIDHHLFSEDLNSEKTVFLNARNFCAASLCYYLFSKIQNLEKFDWLVACAIIADWTYFNEKDFLKKVFKKYGDEFVSEEEFIRESGKFWELQWKLILAIIYFKDDLKKVFGCIGEEFGEIGDLKKYVDEVQKEIEEMIYEFEKEKTELGKGYFWEVPNSRFRIKSIIINFISKKHANKTIILGAFDEGFYFVSARRQDGGENVSELLKKLVNGLKEGKAGGHIKAAGGHVLKKEAEKLKKRIRNLL